MSKKKKIEKFDQLLNSYVEKKDIVKVERNVTDGEANISGVILENSAHFLQIAETSEFEFNGEVIIKKDHFESIRSNAYDKAYKKILKKEGRLTASLPHKTLLNLENWASIFTGLHKDDIHVIVECEDLEDPTFTIGSIHKIGSKSIQVKYYDAMGQIEEKPRKIKYKNITVVTFNDKYTTTFRKYLKDSTKK